MSDRKDRERSLNERLQEMAGGGPSKPRDNRDRKETPSVKLNFEPPPQLLEAVAKISHPKETPPADVIKPRPQEDVPEAMNKDVIPPNIDYPPPGMDQEADIEGGYPRMRGPEGFAPPSHIGDFGEPMGFGPMGPMGPPHGPMGPMDDFPPAMGPMDDFQPPMGPRGPMEDYPPMMEDYGPPMDEYSEDYPPPMMGRRGGRMHDGFRGRGRREYRDGPPPRGPPRGPPEFYDEYGPPMDEFGPEEEFGPRFGSRGRMRGGFQPRMRGQRGFNRGGPRGRFGKSTIN